MALLLIALAGSVGGRAQLATSSPFLPPASAGNAASPTTGAPLELRGLLDSPPAGLKVRIYDPGRKIGAWLSVNERDPNYDFVVKQYDASRDTAAVEYHGQTLILAQHEAKVTSSGTAAPVIPLAQTPPPPMGVPPGPNGTVSASQSQLEAVAAAVAQRRALREQAAQQVNQGGSVAPQVIQQQQQQQLQQQLQQQQRLPRQPNGQPQNQNGQRPGQRVGG